LPASGKSTWAKAQIGKIVVNRDTLRLQNPGRGEATIRNLRDELIKEALLKGKDVISDDTNLIPKTFDALVQLAKDCGATYDVKDFTFVSVDECVKRDAGRNPSVGEKVVRNFVKFLPKNQRKLIEILINPALPNAFIFDVDGTICNFSNKNPYDRDFENDLPNIPVITVLQALAKSYKILIVSGRNGKFKTVTATWFTKHGVEYDYFYIRKEGDNRKDTIIKQEIYESHIKGKYNIIGVFDDRLQVIKFWESLGLFVFNVNQGNIEF
jgi:predicted kinase